MVARDLTLATGYVVTCRLAAKERTSILSECHRNFASL